MNAAFISAIGSLLAGLFCPDAFAWSARGHKTVGEVAFGLLSNNVRSMVTALLGPNDIQHAAIWPDLLRDSLKPTSEFHNDNTNWHFTNAPFIAPADHATVHLPAQGEGKILEAIAANETILKDKTKPAPDRAVAHCWLLHLYGDLASIRLGRKLKDLF